MLFSDKYPLSDFYCKMCVAMAIHGSLQSFRSSAVTAEFNPLAAAFPSMHFVVKAAIHSCFLSTSECRSPFLSSVPSMVALNCSSSMHLASTAFPKPHAASWRSVLRPRHLSLWLAKDDSALPKDDCAATVSAFFWSQSAFNCWYLALCAPRDL